MSSEQGIYFLTVKDIDIVRLWFLSDLQKEEEEKVWDAGYYLSKKGRCFILYITFLIFCIDERWLIWYHLMSRHLRNSEPKHSRKGALEVLGWRKVVRNEGFKPKSTYSSLCCITNILWWYLLFRVVITGIPCLTCWSSCMLNATEPSSTSVFCINVYCRWGRWYHHSAWFYPFCRVFTDTDEKTWHSCDCDVMWCVLGNLASPFSQSQWV